jgi:hypothetical protein
MRRILIGSVVAVAMFGVGRMALPAVSAHQARVCLHGSDETPAERARRGEAVGYTRAINTAQSQHASVNNRYGQIEELAVTRALPAGFAVQHAANAAGYIFSVKDTTDQCRFTIFSDQDGIIYFAEPMQ